MEIILMQLMIKIIIYFYLHVFHSSPFQYSLLSKALGTFAYSKNMKSNVF